MTRLTRCCRGLAVGILVCAFVAGAPIDEVRAATSDWPEGLEVVGLLPSSPWDADGDSKDGYIVSTDATSGSTYYLYLDRTEARWHLVTYRRARTDIPQPIRDFALARDALPTDPSIRPKGPRVAMDAKRQRLYVGWPGIGVARVTVIDLVRGNVQATWAVGEEIPSLDLQGITYSPVDDRIYGIGETTASGGLLGNWTGLRPQVVSIVFALDARDGSRAWMLPVSKCQQPMNTYAWGALIARSHQSDAIYFPCVQTSTAPRPTGMIKLSLGRSGGRGAVGIFRNKTPLPLCGGAPGPVVVEITGFAAGVLNLI